MLTTATTTASPAAAVNVYLSLRSGSLIVPRTVAPQPTNGAGRADTTTATESTPLASKPSLTIRSAV